MLGPLSHVRFHRFCVLRSYAICALFGLFGRKSAVLIGINVAIRLAVKETPTIRKDGRNEKADYRIIDFVVGGNGGRS